MANPITTNHQLQAVAAWRDPAEVEPGVERIPKYGPPASGAILSLFHVTPKA